MGKTIASSGKLTASDTARISIIRGGVSDTFFGTNGNDTFDGQVGNDTIYGAGGQDTLTGGNNSDIIFGGEGDDVLQTSSVRSLGFDTAYGGEGNDTISGGEDNDQLYGGTGDDTLFNNGSHADGELFDGGAGDDGLFLLLSNHADPIIVIGGPDDASDGNDKVVVSGRYEVVKATLGNGNDSYVGNTNEEFAQDVANSDSVSGGAGNDVLSGWFGMDVLDGGTGDDVVWGGIADDSLYGGAGTDYLYGGTEIDKLYGGAQIDFFYWSREDGQGDQIYDEFRTGGSGGGVNGLLAFGTFDANGTLKPGSGVFETDHDVSDKDGMVRVFDISEDGEDRGVDLWRLEIISGDNEGNYVDFDRRDISVIGLWNHEAGPGQQVIQQYVWDGTQYSYVATLKEEDLTFHAPTLLG